MRRARFKNAPAPVEVPGRRGATSPCYLGSRRGNMLAMSDEDYNHHVKRWMLSILEHNSPMRRAVKKRLESVPSERLQRLVDGGILDQTSSLQARVILRRRQESPGRLPAEN